MTLSYGLAVDGSSYFFCGFCDLKVLAARQKKDAIGAIHWLNVVDVRGTDKGFGIQLNDRLHGAYFTPVLFTLDRDAPTDRDERNGVLGLDSPHIFRWSPKLKLTVSPAFLKRFQANSEVVPSNSVTTRSCTGHRK